MMEARFDAFRSGFSFIGCQERSCRDRKSLFLKKEGSVMRGIGGLMFFGALDRLFWIT
jgi:hypothetical protein